LAVFSWARIACNTLFSLGAWHAKQAPRVLSGAESVAGAAEAIMSPAKVRMTSCSLNLIVWGAGARSDSLAFFLLNTTTKL
jgi:hypothetical protein